MFNLAAHLFFCFSFLHFLHAIPASPRISLTPHKPTNILACQWMRETLEELGVEAELQHAEDGSGIVSDLFPPRSLFSNSRHAQTILVTLFPPPLLLKTGRCNDCRGGSRREVNGGSPRGLLVRE